MGLPGGLLCWLSSAGWSNFSYFSQHEYAGQAGSPDGTRRGIQLLRLHREISELARGHGQRQHAVWVNKSPKPNFSFACGP